MRYHRFEKFPFKISRTLIVRSINMRDYVMCLVGDWSQQSNITLETRGRGGGCEVLTAQV